jgi:hypothetical protein
LAGFRIPKITVHEGDDVDQIIKDMEARGEIPPLENFPAGQIRVIVHRIISPPNGERNWERYITSGTNLKIAEAQARDRSRRQLMSPKHEEQAACFVESRKAIATRTPKRFSPRPGAQSLRQQLLSQCPSGD